MYIGNATPAPWWEWTLLSEGDHEDFAAALESELERHEFEVTAERGGPAEYDPQSVEGETEILEQRGWATEWITLKGSNARGLSVFARVADAMTRNNCFPDFGDVITPAEPSDFDIVAVAMFRDEARRRYPRKGPQRRPTSSRDSPT